MSVSGTQNLLTGITFPSFGVSGLNSITTGVTSPSVSVTGLSASSLTQGVTTPTVPAVAQASKSDESSMNWLWILIIIPAVIVGAAAMSKSN